MALSTRIHIVTVVGARPNFMKVAPIMEELRHYDDRVQATLVHTGQHYDDDMSAIFFQELQLREPDVYLGVGSGTHAEQTARVMMGFEKLLLSSRPSIVVVVGDVNSTLACALVAAKLRIPVAHVEAGLRSHDRTMPEEINRIVTDSLSDLLFTTSMDANENLVKEGIHNGRIHFVGNTMIDTLLKVRPFLDNSELRRRFDLADGAYGYITLHRPSNVDDRDIFGGICEAFVEIQEKIPLVWPVHPRTRKQLERFDLFSRLSTAKRLHLAPPLSYLDSVSLMAGAKLVLTDSGGVQEETTVLGVPCLTLRTNTERPVTITHGTNELVGNKREVIVNRAFAIVAKEWNARGIPPFWDGKTAKRIVNVLLHNVMP